MAMLTEEVGEVAHIIARRYGEQSEKESDRIAKIDALIIINFGGKLNPPRSYNRPFKSQSVFLIFCRPKSLLHENNQNPPLFFIFYSGDWSIVRPKNLFILKGSIYWT